jgi:hypothetical protein
MRSLSSFKGASDLDPKESGQAGGAGQLPPDWPHRGPTQGMDQNGDEASPSPPGEAQGLTDQPICVSPRSGDHQRADTAHECPRGDSRS